MTAAAVRRQRRPWRQWLIGWSFALPFVLLFSVFMAGPIIVSFVTSFTDMRVTDIRTPFDVSFVGLDNYFDVFRDATFRKAVRNTVVYVRLRHAVDDRARTARRPRPQPGSGPAAQSLSGRFLPAVS